MKHLNKPMKPKQCAPVGHSLDCEIFENVFFYLESTIITIFWTILTWRIYYIYLYMFCAFFIWIWSIDNKPVLKIQKKSNPQTIVCKKKERINRKQFHFPINQWLRTNQNPFNREENKGQLLSDAKHITQSCPGRKIRYFFAHLLVFQQQQQQLHSISVGAIILTHKHPRKSPHFVLFRVDTHKDAL